MHPNKEGISDKWFYLPILILGVYLVIRLINQSQMLFTFPFDSKNDLPTYMTFLYWLKVYGYHEFVPHWLNGFVLFDVYPPGWFFFAYPLYLLTNNLLYTTYISILLMFLIGAIIIYFFGKSQGFSLARTSAFFALFFISPMAIGDFIKQGRLPEMLAWLFFLAISALIFYYKDKRIDWKFLCCAPLFAALVITHHVETLLLGFVALGLLLVKKNWKERGLVIITFIAGFALSSFWLVPFLKKITHTTILNVNFGKWLLDFSGGFKMGNIALIIMPIVMLLLFYFYWRSHNFSKRELLFFLPALILSALVLTRLTVFIPFLNNIYPDPYQLFILFFITYFFLKTKYELIPIHFKNACKFGLIAIPMIFISVSVFHTAWFIPHTDLTKEVISILPEIEGNFITMGPFPPNDAAQPSIEAFGAINYGLNSSAGLNYVQAEPKHWQNILDLGQSVIKEDCSDIVSLLKETKTTEVLAYEETCNLIETCGLYKKIKKEHFCIYKT